MKCIHLFLICWQFLFHPHKMTEDREKYIYPLAKLVSQRTNKKKENNRKESYAVGLYLAN